MACVAADDWTLGCAHYKRCCKFVAPCCGNVHSCRICHDEKEDHVLNRREISTLICSRCCKMQSLRLRCQKCGICFGKYACLICRLFDNEDKGQFHCKDCGICRTGGESNFFHCDVCNCCLSFRLYDNHKCVENASRGNCPVCLEDLHTSRTHLYVPACGHLLHEKCFEDLKNAGRSSCTICQKNMF